MDQEREFQEIGESEEIKHMMTGLMRTQEAMLSKLEQIAHSIDKLKRHTGKEK